MNPLKRSSPRRHASGVSRRSTRDSGDGRPESYAWQQALNEFRAAAAVGRVPAGLERRARKALIQLGGDPARPSISLKDYDAERFGPFLGVSDEGSAAGAIGEAALKSPKVRALPKGVAPTPIVVGVAVDAERLGGVGEVAVGPDEYADVWLACVDRVLVTTNIGTRANVRVFRREPAVTLRRDDAAAIAKATREIDAAFRPFVDTPDGRPRPLTVFVEIPRYVAMPARRKRAALSRLARHVATGGAAGRGATGAPPGQQLGLFVWTRRGHAGMRQTMDAIDLAAGAGIKVVAIEGVKRRQADRAISLAGLLDYFEPGLVGPILRHAKTRRVKVRAASLTDTDTIARSTWVGLSVARAFGAHLGKYGCFPLTLSETGEVVGQIQSWMQDWSAAPVFFVDQGVLREEAVDVGHDLARGLKAWLETVAGHRVRVVLVDTIDKATGKRLLKRSVKDRDGFLGLNQVKRALDLAHRLGVNVLWAGGLGLRDAYEMGRLGVFGVYVTSAAATTVAVSGSYLRDPSLAGVKEPSSEAVLRVKILLEAGFLSSRLDGPMASGLACAADNLLAVHDAGDGPATTRHAATLAAACVKGWRAYWRRLP